MRFVLLLLFSFLVPTVSAGTEHCEQNARKEQIEDIKEEILDAKTSLDSAKASLDDAQSKISKTMDEISGIEYWQTQIYPSELGKVVAMNHYEMAVARQRLQNKIGYTQTKISTHTLSNGSKVYTGFDIASLGLLQSLRDPLLWLENQVFLDKESREFFRANETMNIKISSRDAILAEDLYREKTEQKIDLKSRLENVLKPQRSQIQKVIANARRELRRLEKALADFSLPLKCCEDCDEDVKPEKDDDVSLTQPQPVIVEIPEFDLELMKPKLPTRTEDNPELDDVLKSLEDADPEAMPNGSCSSSVSTICDPFNPTLADECTEAVWLAVDECEKEPAPATTDPLAQCMQQCSRHNQEANLALDMFEIVIRQIDGVTAQFESYDALDVKSDEVAQELETLIEEAESRIIYIYSNSETNAVVEHDGPYFEPSPPLVYHGQLAIPPTDEQVKRLADVGDELTQLLLDIADRDDALAEKNASLAAWKDDSKRVWQNAVTSDVPLDGCVRSEVETGFQQCQSICTAQASVPNSTTPYVAMDFCRKNSSVFGLLKLPSSQKWLVPQVNE